MAAARRRARTAQTAHSSRSPRLKSGFTLIEVLVAVVVVSMTFMVTYLSMSRSIELIRRSEAAAERAGVIEQAVVDLELEFLDAGDSDEGLPGAGAPELGEEKIRIRTELEPVTVKGVDMQVAKIEAVDDLERTVSLTLLLPEEKEDEEASDETAS
ncbi:MAG: prepilin-type N-terminal cleavage/methylation domain-containing protein [Candidatus Omnitrophica bacterium]|nr:prepilin-type N-terminal cleavage/methylation domain-containing protein [Candidatus Omnitrophota bacterium]